MSGGMEEAARMEREERRQRINWEQLELETLQCGETLKLVKQDLLARETLGLKKYGKALNSKTDDDMLQHLYEELLDASMYIRTLIEQRKKGG